ncbi:hypothetical protein ACKKBG_A35750 [Auxenochlorella protothecoides x Auxenochlorella symbiontica]
MTGSVVKRARTAGCHQHKVGPTFSVPGLCITEHTFTLPLDYSGLHPGNVDVFCRVLVHRNKVSDHNLPYLLYLQGGPGFEAPRPLDNTGWIKHACNYFRIVLMDQRGTGLSSPITPGNIERLGDAGAQALHLTHFRADSIVADAEVIRMVLVPGTNHDGRWTVLGQSFGGFCCVTYLSLAPESLIDCLITGGIPPRIDTPCAAEAVYRACALRVLLQNRKYYSRFPMDVARIGAVVRFLAAAPGGGVSTPAGNLLTPRSLQLLGLHSMGFSTGFERLHYLFEGSFDGPELSRKFLKDFDVWMSWDTNPLYAIMHESIYCQGAASNWAAERVLASGEFADAFDATQAAQAGQPVNFTGEMVFSWMFEEIAGLRPMKEAADILASKEDWPTLYDVDVLEENTVPTAGVLYYEDMFVNFGLAQETANRINGMHQWVTNEYLHCGIREAGGPVFERLLNLCRGGILPR